MDITFQDNYHENMDQEQTIYTTIGEQEPQIHQLVDPNHVLDMSLPMESDQPQQPILGHEMEGSVVLKVFTNDNGKFLYGGKAAEYLTEETKHGIESACKKSIDHKMEKNKAEEISISDQMDRVEQYNQPPEQIKVCELRQLIVTLMRLCYFYLGPMDTDKKGKTKNLWSQKPDDWPANVPYMDPNNAFRDKAKPKKEELVSMYKFLSEKYKQMKPDLQKLIQAQTSETMETDSGSCVELFERLLEAYPKNSDLAKLKSSIKEVEQLRQRCSCCPLAKDLKIVLEKAELEGPTAQNLCRILKEILARHQDMLSDVANFQAQTQQKRTMANRKRKSLTTSAASTPPKYSDARYLTEKPMSLEQLRIQNTGTPPDSGQISSVIVGRPESDGNPLLSPRKFQPMTKIKSERVDSPNQACSVSQAVRNPMFTNGSCPESVPMYNPFSNQSMQLPCFSTEPNSSVQSTSMGQQDRKPTMVKLSHQVTSQQHGFIALDSSMNTPNIRTGQLSQSDKKPAATSILSIGIGGTNKSSTMTESQGLDPRTLQMIEDYLPDEHFADYSLEGDITSNLKQGAATTVHSAPVSIPCALASNRFDANERCVTSPESHVMEDMPQIQRRRHPAGQGFAENSFVEKQDTVVHSTPVSIPRASGPQPYLTDDAVPQFSYPSASIPEYGRRKRLDTEPSVAGDNEDYQILLGDWSDPVP